MKGETQTTTLALASQPAALLPINSVDDLRVLGTIISQCQLFGQSNPAEGLAIVAMCQQKRISWMDFMQNFHMIKGRISKKTDAILADFHRIGGTHEIVSRTPALAEARFTLGANSYTSTISWDDCKGEPFVYQGKEDDVIRAIESGDVSRLAVKAKYRTPRARMQMLWARCVSDGVRAVAPECVQGIYTPEEVDDFSEECTRRGTATTTAPSVVQAAEPVQAPAPARQAVASVEICPVGPCAGRRWDDESVFSTDILQQALGGTHPLITPEMKDYIRGIVDSRQPAAAEKGVANA